MGNKQLSLFNDNTVPNSAQKNSPKLASDFSLTNSHLVLFWFCLFFPEDFLRLKDIPSSSCVFLPQSWNQRFLQSPTLSAVLNGAGNELGCAQGIGMHRHFWVYKLFKLWVQASILNVSQTSEFILTSALPKCAASLSTTVRQWPLYTFAYLLILYTKVPQAVNQFLCEKRKEGVRKGGRDGGGRGRAHQRAQCLLHVLFYPEDTVRTLGSEVTWSISPDPSNVFAAHLTG